MKGFVEGSSSYLERTSRAYSLYVLYSRAIPSLSDGLKTPQRIALSVIERIRDKIKTSAFAAKMIEEELYVHGGVSAEDMVRMLSATYLNNRPLMLGEGAFGTRSAPNEFAAARYTYVKRSPFADKVLYVDSDLAPQVENYDGSKLMPGTFLPLIPLVLLNGVRGMAIGWATRILPRSFDELRAATLEYIRTGEITKRLFPKYEGLNLKVTRGETPAQYLVTGSFERIGENRIRITELPIETHQSIRTLDDYRQMLIDYESWGLIEDFTDNSKDTIDIDIKLGVPGAEVNQPKTIKGAAGFKTYPVPKWTDEKILDLFEIRSTMSEQIVVLGMDPIRPIQFDTAQDVIKAFVDWRLKWYKTRYERFAQADLSEELFHRCYLACHDENLPNDFSILDNKADLKRIIKVVILKYGLEVREELVERLAVLPGYRWTKEGRNEAEQAARTAAESAKQNLIIAKSPTKQKQIYESELEAISRL